MSNYTRKIAIGTMLADNFRAKHPPAQPYSCKVDLAPIRQSAAKYFCGIPKGIYLKKQTRFCLGLDHGRQPLPAFSERAKGTMGPGALRTKMAGSRSDKYGAVSLPGKTIYIIKGGTKPTLSLNIHSIQLKWQIKKG